MSPARRAAACCRRVGSIAGSRCKQAAACRVAVAGWLPCWRRWPRRPAWAAADPFDGDPFKSFQWPDLKKEFVGAGARTRFDDRVKVLGPAFAEDSMNVPITVSASLPGVQRLIVLVDRNPIRKVLEL